MPIHIEIADEGPPKRLIIEMAFSEAGAAGYEFGRTPEEVADALARLNAMMAEWLTFRGIDLNYDQPEYGVGNADVLSGIPHAALNAVAAHLALRICPMMGAGLSPEAKANLARSLAALEGHYARIPAMPMSENTPRGTGAQHTRVMLAGPYIRESAAQLNEPE